MSKVSTINKIKNKGFTLIELMITVAIVGILAAVALPAYQDYTIRAQLTEGLSLASGHKTTVSEYYSNHGDYPTAADLDMPNAIGKYISGTTIGADGEIIATFGGSDVNSNITGKTLTLKPTEQTEGNLSWNCFSDAAQKYLPTSCTFQAGTNTGNPGGGTTPPVATGPYTGDATYARSNYELRDGKMYNLQQPGQDWTVISTDPDGTQYISPWGGAAPFNSKLLPDGTFILQQYPDANNQNTDTFYTDQSMAFSSFTQFEGQRVEIKNLQYDGFDRLPNQTQMINTASEFNQLAETFKNNPTAANKAAYESSLASMRQTIAQSKDANGNFPAGYPLSLARL